MTDKKKIAISGYYGFENFGDEAILQVLVNELKDRGYSVTVFSKNPSITNIKLIVNAVNRFSLKDLFFTLFKSDVLVSGGGSLLQDVTSLKSLFYYLFVIWLALLLRNEVIIFAQGIGPINSPVGRFFTKYLLKKCKFITVRDEKSLFLLRGWGLTPELVSDPVWSIKTDEKKSENRVGVQLRSWGKLSQKYLMTLARNIVERFSDKEILIYSFQDSLDLELCKHFDAQLKLLNPSVKTRIVNGFSVDAVVKSFASLDYLIAMRYHACMLGVKYGIPTLALSYDEKVKKLSEKFELPCSFLDENEDFKQLFDNLENMDLSKMKEKAKSCVSDFQDIINAIE